MTLGPSLGPPPVSGALPLVVKTLPPFNYLALIPTRLLYFWTRVFY